MIDLNLCLELSKLVPEQSQAFLDRAKQNVELIENKFFDDKLGLLREAIPVPNPDDDPEDTFEGRLVNPGHIMECLWFLMTAAEQFGDQNLVQKCAKFMLSTLDFGWDKLYGGIFYFLDVRGKPPQQLEWDQKLWWVHLESIYAVLLAWKLTRREEFAVWYFKLHDWIWNKFHDAANGEFFGYLNRRGEVLLELKGGKWKGFFHVPRQIMLCGQLFEELEKETPKNE
jgi:N-acylglucosamine 2-epimerase